MCKRILDDLTVDILGPEIKHNFKNILNYNFIKVRREINYKLPKKRWFL